MSLYLGVDSGKNIHAMGEVIVDNKHSLELDCKCGCSKIVIMTEGNRDFINIDFFKNPQEKGMVYLPFFLDKDSLLKLKLYIESLNL